VRSAPQLGPASGGPPSEAWP